MVVVRQCYVIVAVARQCFGVRQRYAPLLPLFVHVGRWLAGVVVYVVDIVFCVVLL